MRKALIIIVAAMCTMFLGKAIAQAPSPSVYAVKSENTASGYKYYFAKINSSTGASTNLAQLPIKGHANNRMFSNSNGNIVFLATDTVSASTYVYKLYEYDTSGKFVRALPAKPAWAGAPVPSVDHLFQSPNSRKYYGITRDGDDKNLISIDPVTGADTILATVTMPNHPVQFTSVIDKADNIYFFLVDATTQIKRLMKASVSTKTIVPLDSFEIKGTLNNLFYDCSSDNLYAFFTPDTAVSTDIAASEWVKINKSTGKVTHTGTGFIGTGGFYIYTTLSSGQYFQFTSTSTATRFSPSSVTGAFFNLPATTISAPNGPFVTITAPPISCGYNYGNTTDINEATVSGNISVFPNPAGDIVILKAGKGAIGQKYFITDQTGRKVMTGTLRSEVTNISVSSLPSGIYFIRSEGNSNLNSRFVKQ